MRCLIIAKFLILSISLNTFGQVSDSLSRHKIYKLPKSEQSFDLSFRFPVGAFGDDFQANTSSNTGGMAESMDGSTGGMGAQMGYELGLTGNYYFDKKPSNLNTGLRITYFSFSTIPFSWKTSGDYIFNDAEYSNLDFLSVKAGIVFRLAVAEKKSFVFYDQLCFAYGWNGGMIYDGSQNNSYVSDQAELNINNGTGIRDEIGASFRTGHFVADFGFSFGKITYSDVQFTRDLSAPGYYPLNIDRTFSASMPTSTIELSVGVGF